MAPKKTLILGANGQVGRALARQLPNAVALDRRRFDITNAASYDEFDWRAYDTIINAAAYTAVDEAETPDGRRASWSINVSAASLMASVATQHRLTLVHVSSDYVFDGSEKVHVEGEPFSPLGVYGQGKAAADAIVSSVARHYIVRTSWVIGDGNNFVRTMASLAKRNIEPKVVNDQFGRLSFADDIATGIVHLLSTSAPFGTYNLSNEGPTVSWADIAVRVYELTGRPAESVTGISTEDYFAGKSVAPRPRYSSLDLSKLASTGFVPRQADEALRGYLMAEQE